MPKRPQVEIEFTGSLPRGLTREAVKEIVSVAAGLAQRREKISLGLAVVGDKEIQRLNATYRGKDAVTDVLSFANEDHLTPPCVTLKNEPQDIGDIIVCLPQVKRQAKASGRRINTEFALMIAHGTLHLLGYDHLTIKDETVMFAMQQEALMLLGYL